MHIALPHRTALHRTARDVGGGELCGLSEETMQVSILFGAGLTHIGPFGRRSSCLLASPKSDPEERRAVKLQTISSGSHPSFFPSADGRGDYSSLCWPAGGLPRVFRPVDQPTHRPTDRLTG